jgi:hypothetical protein
MAQRFLFVSDFNYIHRSPSGSLLWVRSYRAGTTALVPRTQIAAVEASGKARRVDAGQSASGSITQQSSL